MNYRKPRIAWLVGLLMFLLLTAIVGLIGSIIVSRARSVERNRLIVAERQALFVEINAHSYFDSGRYDGDLWVDTRNDAERILLMAQEAGWVTANAKVYPATQVCGVSPLRRSLGDSPIYIITTSDPKAVPKIRKHYPEAICILDPNYRPLYP